MVMVIPTVKNKKGEVSGIYGSLWMEKLKRKRKGVEFCSAFGWPELWRAALLLPLAVKKEETNQIDETKALLCGAVVVFDFVLTVLSLFLLPRFCLSVRFFFFFFFFPSISSRVLVVGRIDVIAKSPLLQPCESAQTAKLTASCRAHHHFLSSRHLSSGGRGWGASVAATQRSASEQPLHCSGPFALPVDLPFLRCGITNGAEEK